MSVQKTSGKMQLETTDRAIVITRTFDAPRELVFATFSDCKHLKHWWGPKGWSLSVCEIDFRPEGVWLYCMTGPEGEESWGKSIFSEIVAPEKIVYTDYFVDSTGNPIDGAPWWASTTTFTEQDGKTIVYNYSEISNPDMLQSMVEMGAIEGIRQTWDRLEEYLAGR